MKKMIWIIAFLVTVATIYGQTVDETIEWMNSKFEKACEIWESEPSRYNALWHCSASLNDDVFILRDWGYGQDEDGKTIYGRDIYEFSLLDMDEDSVKVWDSYPYYGIEVWSSDDSRDCTCFEKVSYQEVPTTSETLAMVPSMSQTLYISLPSQGLAEKFANAMRYLIITAKEESGYIDF